MTKNLINSDNWTFCHFASDQLKAVVTIGADPARPDLELLYFVTVVDKDNNQTFQKEFSQIEQACAYINKRYQKIWDFIDATKKEEKSGGCSTCIAH